MYSKKARKRKKNPWETEKILSKRTSLKNASALQRANPNVTNLKKVKQAKKDLRLSYEQEQAAYVQSKIDEIKSAADNKQSALAWKTVNEISGRKKTTKAKIKANDQAERVSKWKDHFQNLLGNPPNVLNRPTQKIFENELDIKRALSPWMN